MPFDIKKVWNSSSNLRGRSYISLQQLTNTRNHSYKLAKSLCSHDIYKYFYTNRIVDLWNSLPNEVVSVQSLHAFKYKVSRLNL